MTRQDELDAMMEILDKLLGWDTDRFQLSRQTPPDIRRFLRSRPSRRQLNRAHLAIYAAAKALERREAARQAQHDHHTDP